MSSAKNRESFFAIKKIPIILCPPKGAAALLSEGRRLVCLIRHGQTDWNLERRLQGRERVPLNEQGIEQARGCGELLFEASKLGLVISDMFSSPLSRARTTAEIIAEKLEIKNPVIDEDGLIERDYGELSGLTLEERRRRFPKGEKQAKGVESVADSAMRMKKCVCRIAAGGSGGAVAAITHGGIINAYYLSITRSKIGTGKNICENCHVSLLAFGREATIPLVYNLGGEMFLDYIKQMRLREIL